ncbi:adhesin biosynthesis transcription regulatory family protein [Escherichia coli]|nr:adhesin biosynthesis transcription regulatory family protein [Escherichia coli]MDW6176159.1 adhesin biosynthesis transcription regulatory family protein [Escherichia coli]URE57900.1 adhesin biosynthesis transcription regulatory family protein [Escherichia coli]UWB90753.1 adhesin biosynthesis transcription regulatory family protein [Escherichia coli O25b:H4-ST131]
MTKGNISERDFDILIKLSGIHSEKAILALKKYYVGKRQRSTVLTLIYW